MTSSIPAEPEVLYRKPGTVTAAQTLMWIQFSFLLCCGTAGAFGVLFSAGFLGELTFDERIRDDVENLVVLLASVVTGVVAVSVCYGILAAKLGAGRRWAQVATIIVMLVVIVSGFVGMATDFRLEDRTGAPVDGFGFASAVLSMTMPMTTLICLCTGSANQWFRQRGREPWLRQWKGALPRY